MPSRHLLSVFLLWLLVPALGFAVTLNSGSLRVEQQGATILRPLSLNGPNLSINPGLFSGFGASAPGPSFCDGLATTCTFNFSFSGNQTFNSTGFVIYNGVSYSLSSTTVLDLTLTVSGSSTVSRVTTGTPPNQTWSASTSNVPFTLSGLATLTVNGTPIFGNLPLTGGGLASGSWFVNNSNASTGAFLDWQLADSSPVPEPSSVTLFVVALGAFALRSRARSTRP